MELILGLLTSVVVNLLKKMIAKYGALATKALVLVISGVAAILWHFYGQQIDWTTWLAIGGIAVGFYEFVLKNWWPNK